MIKDIKLWDEFEKELNSNEKPDFEKNLKLFHKMKLISSSFKRKSDNDLLNGIETKIRIAKYLNKPK